jgi:DNA-directed RNA polymerase subunit N (RpoN/RPB10)
MLCPILCSCGRSLDDYYDAFKAYRVKKWGELLEKSSRDILPEYIMVANDLYPELAEFFDWVHMPLSCCRTKLLTATEFNE